MLKAEPNRSLLKNWQLANDYVGKRTPITVEGHTDDVGSADSNHEALSNKKEQAMRTAAQKTFQNCFARSQIFILEMK